MLDDAFWLKCSSLSLSSSFLTKKHIILLLLPPCLLFSPIPHRNPGYTLAAAAPRSVLRVQGGANLQRVGASRRSQARCHCLATVAHWEKRESAEKEEEEEEEEGKVRATGLSRSVGCSATMSSLIVPSTSNQRQRCIVAARLTNRTTRLSHPPASSPFLPSYRFSPANNARPQRDWYRTIRITDRFRPRHAVCIVRQDIMYGRLIFIMVDYLYSTNDRLSGEWKLSERISALCEEQNRRENRKRKIRYNVGKIERRLSTRTRGYFVDRDKRVRGWNT